MSLAMACNNTLEGLGSLSQNSSMNLGAYGDDSASGGFGPDFTQLTEDSALQEILMNMQQTDSKFGGMEGGGPGTWTPPSQLDMWISTVPEADSGGSMPSMHSKFTSDRRLAALGERDMLIDPPQEGRTNLFHSFWDGVPPVPKWSSDPSQNLGNSMLLSPGLNSDVSSSSFLTEQDLKPSMASMFRSSSATALGSLGSFQGFSGSLMPPLEPQPGGLDAILNTLVSQQQQQQQQQSGVPQRRMSDGQLYNRSAQTLLNHQTQIQQSILLKSILEEHMAQRLPPKKPASHSAAERRRRDRINDRFNTLRELVPGCSKSDKASVLAEVIEYVKKLQVQSRLWEDKHLASSTVTPDAMSHEKQQQMNEITAWRGTGHTDSPATTSGATHTQEEEGNSLGDDISIEADGTALLIKICCPDRKGLLAGISAALRDLSLYVHEADVVTSNSRAVDTFRVVPEGNLVQSMDIIKRRLLAVAFPGGVPVHLAVVKQELHLQTPDTRLKNDEKRRRISSEG